MIPDLPSLALYPAAINGFAPHQLLTYSLVHGNWPHLIGNAIALAAFFTLSAWTSSIRYAAICFFIGILAGGIAGYLLAPAICLGASSGVVCLLSSMRGTARTPCVIFAMATSFNPNVLHLAGFFAGIAIYLFFLLHSLYLSRAGVRRMMSRHGRISS